jgi:hypothetical protein
VGAIQMMTGLGEVLLHQAAQLDVVIDEQE